MAIQLVPTFAKLPENIRGLQIIEQDDGRYSIYTETGSWSKLQEEVLLGKDLTETEAVAMYESFNLPVDTISQKKKKTTERGGQPVTA